MKRAYIPFVLSVVILAACTVVHAQPGDEDRRYKLARGYEESNDLRNASRVYKELYDQDRQSNVYFEGVRRTYMGLLLYGDLLPIVEQRLPLQSGDVDLHSLYAELLNRTGQPDQAARAWNDAIELRPDDAMTYMIVGQSQIDNRLFDRATRTFLRGRQRLGDPTAFADQLAQLYAILGQFEEAATEYVGMLNLNPSQLGFVMSGMGLFTTNPKGADAAIAIVRSASESRADYLPLVELLSWLYTEKGDYESAFDVARRLDDLRNARGSNIYAFADAALREGHYDVAASALEYFLKTFPKTNPLYTSALYSYTRTLEQRYHAKGAGSKDEAEALIDRYLSMISDNPGNATSAEALLQVARLQADDLDEPQDAIATLEQLRRDYPRSPSIPEAVLMEGDLTLRTDKLREAQELYRQGAAKLQPGRDAERYRDLSALRLAETLFYSGEFKQAVDSFTALTQNTSSDVTNDALQYLFLLQENFEKQDEALKHYAAGRLLLMQHEWKRAIEEMDRAVTAAPKSSLADDALYGKSQAQEALDIPADAMATLLQIIEQYPDGTHADRALFHAAELAERKMGDRQRAAELYTRLLTEYPASTFINPSRARIRALRGES
jgi:tetratricopeptide (TPR) repeat protein